MLSKEKKIYLLLIISYILIMFFVMFVFGLFINNLYNFENVLMFNEIITNRHNAFANLIIYILLLGIVISFSYKFLISDLIDFFKIFILSFILVIFMLITNYFFSFVGVVIIDSLNLSQSSINQQGIIQMASMNYLLIFIATVICAPIVEEIIFRKCIFGLIKNSTFAIIVSGFSFGFLHVIFGGDYFQSIPYIITGFVYAIFYYVFKKNIIYPISAHILNNLIAMIIIFLL